MSRILLIGASGGIGAALSQAHQARGDEVTGLSRTSDGLDVTDEQSVDAVLCPLDERFDRIIIASGALEIDGAAPEKSIKSISQKAMMDQMTVNAIGPALVLRHAPRLLARQGGQVAVLSARVGSIGDNRLGGWYSYRASKAALNQLIHTAAIEVARSHRRETIWHPVDGLIRTDQSIDPRIARIVGTTPS